MQDRFTEQDRAFLRVLAQELAQAVAQEIRPLVSAPRDQGQGAAYLSVQEAAEVLGVAAKTIHALIRRGELRSYRVGRLVRIQRDDLNACVMTERDELVDVDARCDEILERSTKRLQAC
jgi:excisionase family DNA binding protein